LAAQSSSHRNGKVKPQHGLSDAAGTGKQADSNRQQARQHFVEFRQVCVSMCKMSSRRPKIFRRFASVMPHLRTSNLPGPPSIDIDRTSAQKAGAGDDQAWWYSGWISRDVLANNLAASAQSGRQVMHLYNDEKGEIGH
jgi:hypothetical protein